MACLGTGPMTGYKTVAPALNWRSMSPMHPLESRCHLAVTLDVVGKTLYFNGDAAADRLVVSQSPAGLVVASDQNAQTFDPAAVDAVSFRLGGGDDAVSFDPSVTLPLYAEAGLGDGNDVFTGPANGVSRVVGGAGDDTITGGAGDDTLRGEAGDDVLVGGGGRDALYGHGGADALDGGGDNDYLDGGDDNDTLLGGGGLDVLVAGAGDDAVYGGFGDDWAEGDAGDDLLAAADAGRDDDAGGLYALGGDGNDSLVGSNGDDSLDGGLGNDTLRGGGGLDDLFGGDDTEGDQLDGGDGGDGLIAGPGDTVTGGGGADRFLEPVDLADRLDLPIVTTDYRSSSDARLRFTDDNAGGAQTPRGTSAAARETYGRWSLAEVKTADRALSLMQHTLGNVSLFKSRVDGREFEFRKTAPRDDNVVGSYLAGFIRVYGGDLDEFLPATIAHEIAHDYNDVGTRRDYADLSGWRQSRTRPGSDYARSSDFSSDDQTPSGDVEYWYKEQAWFPTEYARTDPFEDFAETWEFYWRTLNADADRWQGNPRLDDGDSLEQSVKAEKLAVIDAIVSDLKSA